VPVSAGLADAAHRALIDWYTLSAERTPGSRWERSEDELLVDAPHPFPFLKNVIRAHDRPDGAELISRAEKFFGAGSGFSVYTRPTGEDEDLEQACRVAGLTLAMERYPEMVCERRVKIPALPARAEIREVESPEEEEAFWEVCGESYPSLGFPPDLFTIYAPGYLTEPPFEACLGWLDGRPAASALLAIVGDVGLVGWVATLPDARGQGLGEACTAWVTNRIFEQGASLATLQASPMGEPVYTRMGYEEIFGYRLWLRATPP
jgi:GNAT superfamily N-acetyltransferase